MIPDVTIKAPPTEWIAKYLKGWNKVLRKRCSSKKKKEQEETPAFAIASQVNANPIKTVKYYYI